MAIVFYRETILFNFFIKLILEPPDISAFFSVDVEPLSSGIDKNGIESTMEVFNATWLLAVG